MPESGDMVVLCSDYQQIVAVMNQIMPSLAPEVRRRLNTVKLAYLQAYGVKGLYDRVNGRSVAQVLAEYQEPQGRSVVAEGERDGDRFTLCDLPRGSVERGASTNRPRD
jgi:hypothetical protein